METVHADKVQNELRAAEFEMHRRVRAAGGLTMHEVSAAALDLAGAGSEAGTGADEGKWGAAGNSQSPDGAAASGSGSGSGSDSESDASVRSRSDSGIGALTGWLSELPHDARELVADLRGIVQPAVLACGRSTVGQVSASVGAGAGVGADASCAAMTEAETVRADGASTISTCLSAHRLVADVAAECSTFGVHCQLAGNTVRDLAWIVAVLSYAGARMHGKMSGGWTPLMVMCWSGHAAHPLPLGSLLRASVGAHDAIPMSQQVSHVGAKNPVHLLGRATENELRYQQGSDGALGPSAVMMLRYGGFDAFVGVDGHGVSALSRMCDSVALGLVELFEQRRRRRIRLALAAREGAFLPSIVASVPLAEIPSDLDLDRSSERRLPPWEHPDIQLPQNNNDLPHYAIAASILYTKADFVRWRYRFLYFIDQNALAYRHLPALTECIGEGHHQLACAGWLLTRMQWSPRRVRILTFRRAGVFDRKAKSLAVLERALEYRSILGEE